MQFVDYTIIQPTAITACCSGLIRTSDSNDFVLVKAERKIEFVSVISNEGELVLDVFVQLDSYNTVNNVICVKNNDLAQTDFIVIALRDSINIVQLEDNKFKQIKRVGLDKKTERFIKSKYLATDKESGSFITAAIQGGFDFYCQTNGNFEKQTVIMNDCVCFGFVNIGNDKYVALVHSIQEKKKYVKIFDCNNISNEPESIEVNDCCESIYEIGPNSFALSMNNQLIVYNSFIPITYILPRRETMNENVIVHITNVISVMSNEQIVILIQNELGDVFRILENSNTAEYFDTISPSFSWAASGDVLFSASESQDHFTLQIPDLTKFIETTPFYTPQNNNFQVTTPIASLHPLTSIEVVDGDDYDIFRMHAFIGKGSRSSVKTLTHGLNVDECMSFQLENPKNIWTLKPFNEKNHKFVVIGFENQTYVLKTETDALKQCPECGIRPNLRTLHAGMFIDGTLVQIHAHGIITILNEKLSEQDPGAQRTILLGTSSSYQVVIALRNAQSKCEIVYFEYSVEKKKLIEVERRIFGSDVKSMYLGDFENGKAKKIAFVCTDGSVNVLGLDKESKYLPLLESNLFVEGEANSIILTQFNDLSQPHLFIGIGMEDGYCYGYKVMNNSAEKMWCKNIGTDPVTFSECEVLGGKGVVISSSKMVFMYSYFSRLEFTPISYSPLCALSSFSTDFSGDSLAGITNQSLVVISLDSLDDRFTIIEQPLLFTPRKVIKTLHFPTTLICGDNRCMVYTPQVSEETGEFNERKIGADLQEDGVWASEVGIVEESVFKSYIKTDEAMICGAHVLFKKRKHCFVCSQVKNYKDNEGECWIVVYNSNTFNILHKTPVEKVCRALCSCGERLLAGIGTTLRLYDLGKQILIRKCELNNIPSVIYTIEVIGDKIVLGTASSGFIYVNYDSDSNILSITERDRIWHSLTATSILDETTTIGFDRLGSMFITESSLTSNQLNIGKSIAIANETVHWYVGDVVTSVSINEIWKGTIENEPATFEEQIKENKNVIVYSCLMGRIGVLVPLNFRGDVEFFTKLEMEIKRNYSPLLSDSFDNYRGTNYPSIGVIDGDLCDFYNQMDSKLQLQIAQNLDLTPVQIQTKCEEFKHSKLF